jgi:uncharacterized protein YjbI with pentapeptide repeats
MYSGRSGEREECLMSEQQTTSANQNEPHRDEPTMERQAELRNVYVANLAVGKPPYAGAEIASRGELDWIMRERGWGVVGNRLTQYNLPDLRNTGLEGDMSTVNLKGADLRGALIDARFIHADLSMSDLSEAKISGDFSGADLTGANLGGALTTGNFSGADLTTARMDAATIFGGFTEEAKAHLDTATRLLDVSWNGAILARVNWKGVTRLGDEAYIRHAPTRRHRVQAYQDVARAYFGLSKALEAQGLTAPALRYRRRQHQLERAAQLRNFNLLAWLFSSALNIVSGYGDRPLRALGVYLAVIVAFAGAYLGITTPGSPIFFGGSQPLQLHEAVVLSLSSFHGRGFFPSTVSLGDPVATVAALEAIVGLFIELVLIATFTRRLFER